jgi:hypothetical protein
LAARARWTYLSLVANTLVSYAFVTVVLFMCQPIMPCLATIQS